MAELAARHTGTQTVVADRNRIILELISKRVSALGHGADKDANALLGAEIHDVVPHAHNGRVERERDFAAVGRQVVGDGVLDDLEQLLLRSGGADGEFVQELDHEAGEALEGARDADRGRDFDEDALGGVDVDLEFAGFVDGGVEEGEEALGWWVLVGIG